MRIKFNKRFENSPLIEAKDKRKTFAFQFTGTDKNIDKIVRTVRPLFKGFLFLNNGEDDDFCLEVKYKNGVRANSKLKIGDWITLKNEEGKMVVKVVTNKLFNNYYEVVEDTCDEEKA
jgi:hypothetical protein